MARGMVPACRDNHPRSSKENHPKTSPDRLTEADLLGLIYGLTPFVFLLRAKGLARVRWNFSRGRRIVSSEKCIFGQTILV